MNQIENWFTKNHLIINNEKIKALFFRDVVLGLFINRIYP
jgi:hypothetical protein